MVLCDHFSFCRKSLHYLQVFYLCRVWSILQQEPPEGVSGMARSSTQDISQLTETHKLCLWLDLDKGGDLHGCLKFPPGELLQQLVKCLVVPVGSARSSVSGGSIVHSQSIVSSMQRPAGMLLGHQGSEGLQCTQCVPRYTAIFNYRTKSTFILVSPL